MLRKEVAVAQRLLGIQVDRNDDRLGYVGSSNALPAAADRQACRSMASCPPFRRTVSIVRALPAPATRGRGLAAVRLCVKHTDGLSRLRAKTAVDRADIDAVEAADDLLGGDQEAVDRPAPKSRTPCCSRKALTAALVRPPSKPSISLSSRCAAASRDCTSRSFIANSPKLSGKRMPATGQIASSRQAPKAAI